MSATAFKNAVQRREHRERSQPEARQRFGLLEKHSDYQKRARNYHAKEKRIATLKQKAANRNPDEFYFAMTNSGTKDGVHKATSERPKLTADMLKLLKSQDKTYIQTVKGAEDKKIERLQSSLHLLSSEPLNTHTVFVDSAAEAASFDPAEYFDTAPELVDRAFNRPRKRKLAELELSGAGGDGVERRVRKKVERAREGAYAELEERLDRADKLDKLRQHMDLQRALMQKGRRKKVQEASGDAPAVYKWKPERKK